jgi:hypothetical protein
MVWFTSARVQRCPQSTSNAACLCLTCLGAHNAEVELWEHLGSAVASQAVRSVVILRWAGGSSRGVAKVVMRTPDDVATAIGRLNGEALGGRPLTLCLDRL